MLMRPLLVAFCVVLACGLAAAQSVVLEFDAPVPGTLADANGNGTGFTHRLPGTGGALPANDPNLMLGGGRLTATSQVYGIGLGNPNGSVPCVVCDTALGQNFTITLRLLGNMQGNNAFTSIVVGTSATDHIMYIVSDNGVTGMQASWVPNWVQLTSTVVFPGQDLELKLRRSNGAWIGDWKNLTTSAMGTTGPQLAGAFQGVPNLFVGVGSGHPSWAGPHIDTIDRFSVVFDAVPQANSPDARLEFNGIGAGTSPGPFAVSLASGSQFTLSWGGPPNAAIALFAGPMTPLTLNFGCVGSVGIGTPGLLYSDVSVVIDGTAPGYQSLLFHTDGSGAATQIGGWPLPPGTTLGLQGLIFQPPASPCGMVLTAAFGVTTT